MHWRDYVNQVQSESESTRFERVSSEESPGESIHGSHNPQCDGISSIRYAQGGDPEKILPTLAGNTNELRPLFVSESLDKSSASQAIKDGGSGGVGIWGPPKVRSNKKSIISQNR
jgi:hypothetical protein